MFVGSEMIVSRPKSARRALQVWSIRMFAFTGVSIVDLTPSIEETYAFEIPMNHPSVMNVDQPLSDTDKLEGWTIITKR